MLSDIDAIYDSIEETVAMLSLDDTVTHVITLDQPNQGWGHPKLKLCWDHAIEVPFRCQLHTEL